MTVLAQEAITISYQALGLIIAAFVAFNGCVFWVLNLWINSKIDRILGRIPPQIWTTPMMESMRLDFMNQNPTAKVRSAVEIYREHAGDSDGRM